MAPQFLKKMLNSHRRRQHSCARRTDVGEGGDDGLDVAGMAEKTGLLSESDWPPGKILPSWRCRREAARSTERR